MLNTILDYSVFERFTVNQPKPVPVGTLEDNEYWNSFWKYLKEGSNLTITNLNNTNNIFLNHLTTGRKGTCFNSEEKFKKPHKEKFPKDTQFQTVFFLNELSGQKQKKYREKNGYLFGFPNDYLEIWKTLSLMGKEKTLPVRKSAKKRFEKWEQLSNYITPFTDMLIVDNFMFDETVWDYNLFRIIKIFTEKTPIKFNLLLVSLATNQTLGSYGDIEQKIKQKLNELKINCNLSIVLSPQIKKEHDRTIITNYLRIRSGDSFIYFDKNGKYKTHGTDIDFHSLAERDQFNAADAALHNVKKIIEDLQTHHEKGKRLFGDLKNNLIS